MDKHSDMKADLALARRVFIQRSAAALGGTVLGLPAIAWAKDCKLTEQEILGPMYNYGAPFQAKLAGDGEPGEKLMLTGTVYSQDCSTPLPRTLIEIWQADNSGVYDKKKPGDFSEPPMPFHLRGMLLTDDKGRYEIETIVPGSYPIPPGVPGLEKYAGLTRARHIHIKVLPGLHVPLTTQLYFKGDPHLAKDPWGGHKPSLALDPKQNGKYLRAEFDFILASGLS
jgi:catechol 1,2-dioxygenase